MFITAQIIAQAMRKDDPLYSPANVNPFASIGTLKDGRKLFEIPRQRKFSSSSSYSSEAGTGFRRWESVGSCDLFWGQESQSLPSSPIMLRKAAEKLHQASLHGSEAVQMSPSRLDISLTLGSEGYESEGPLSWDGDSLAEPDGTVSDEQEAEARRAKFTCNRTRSLGSLDFWTPPRHSKGPGAPKPLKTPGGDSQRNLCVTHETNRPGFCNRVTSEIRESSLENILEPSTLAVSSTAFCGEGDTCVDNDCTSVEVGEESMCDASDADDDLNSASAFYSVTENLPAAAHQVNSLVSPAVTSQTDGNRSNIAGACTVDGEDGMVLGECEADGRSVSSSSLSSYLSCSELGDDVDGEGELTLIPAFSSPHRPATPPPQRAQHHTSRQPLIERTLLVNSDSPLKLLQTVPRTSYSDSADSASLTPLIAGESGSFDQNHFGSVVLTNADLSTKGQK